MGNILNDDYPTLFSRLKDYSQSGAAPFHMPGHKRNPSGIEFLEKLGARYDITEISAFDDLHHPQGILAEAMEKAAAIWKSDRCFFLVNGSTCGILAAVRAAAKTSGSSKIIMARNSHRSVYNAAELCGLTPVYLAPQSAEDFGFCGSISPKAVELSVLDNPGAPVILTSPTYEGVISNISEIAIICHLHGSALIVDEAHGAHLDLSPSFKGGAIRAGADIVVQSLHKTMTGLTQSGLLHLCGGLISAEDIQRELAVFETSSPSYLLMASIDGTAYLVSKRGGELFSAWQARLDLFDRLVAPLQNIKIPGHSQLFDCQKQKSCPGYQKKGIESPEIYGFDRSKIIISVEGTDTTGVAVFNELRSRFGLECELAAGGYALAMTGLLDTEDSIRRLGRALCVLDGETRLTLPRLPQKQPKIPPARLGISEALSSPRKKLALRDAQGKISAEYVWAYPPGIPLVTPGEELTSELLTGFIIQREAGVSLRSTFGGMPKTIETLR
ncbi:MAG: aminotransferase class I/II-fold pyridoxal phosphate-dependent enzyme [Oscillospiraceae bacterium]